MFRRNKEKKKGGKFKLFVKRVFALGVLTLGLIFFCNWRVDAVTDPKVFDDTEEIDYNKVGLVLGTSQYLVNGNLNYYFKYRIEAAVELYEAGKVDYFIVSGDNSIKEYDEASDMKEALIAAGVPEDKIYCDYAGFRTLDSVVRCDKIFGQKSITIISQEFHNRRAIFIAKNKGIDAVGYNAQNVSRRYGMRVVLREYLARVKVFLDLYILFKQPKFLGDEIAIGE